MARGAAGRGRGRGRGAATRSGLAPPSVQTPSLFGISSTGAEHGMSYTSSMKAPLSDTVMSNLSENAPTGMASNTTTLGMTMHRIPKATFDMTLIHLPIPRPLDHSTGSHLSPSSNSVSIQKSRLVVNKNFNESIKSSLYYLESPVESDGIDRYSDKFCGKSHGARTSHIHTIHTDVSFLPEELALIYKPDKVRSSPKPASLAVKDLFEKLQIDLLEKLDEKMVDETMEQDINEEQKEQDEEEGIVEDEEYEEDNDYNTCYFDPGDDYGEDDDYGGGAGDYW